jgi:hypothetical protein
MRAIVLGAAALTVAVGLLLWLGAGLDLEVQGVALLGVLLGGVVALVPDRTPGWRVAGAAIGFVVSFVCYAVRVGMLPDTTGGQAVAAMLCVALVGVVAVLGFGRIPLWSLLLGAGAVVGGYEATYVAAPSDLPNTIFSALTSLLLALAVGLLAGSLAAPTRAKAEDPAYTGEHVSDDEQLEAVR